MATPLALVWDLIARDNASPAFTRVAASADKAAVSTERAAVGTERAAAATHAASARIASAGAALTKGITVPFLAVAGVSLKMAGDFQQATNVLVTAAGESTKNLALVRKGILDISSSTGTSWKQVTDGMYLLEKAGYRGAAALQVEKAAAQGAREENASLATVTQAMTSIMASYHLPASQAVKVMNEMKTAAGESKTTMEQFAGSLSTVLPLASANKISFADIAGTLASLTQHGTSADEAAQELAFTMRGLAAPNQVAIKEMAQLGISSVDVATKLGDGPGGRGLAGTLNYLSQTVLQRMGKSGTLLLSTFNASKVAAHDAQIEYNHLGTAAQKLADGYRNGTITQKEWTAGLKGLTPMQAALARQFATTESNAKGFQTAIRNGVSGSQTYSDAIKKMTGGANGLNVVLQTTGASMDGTNERIKRIADSARGAGKDVSGWASTQKLFNVQMDMLKQKVSATLITLGTQLIPVFLKVVNVVKAGVDWFSHLSGTTKKFILIAVACAAAIGPLVSIIGAVGTALSFLAANPVIAAIAGLAALTAGLIYAYNHSKTFRDVCQKAFTDVNKVVQALKPVFTVVFHAIGQAIHVWWTVNKPIFIATGALFRATGAAISWTWSNVIHPAIQAMADFYGWLFHNVIGPISDAISAAFGASGNGLKWVWNNVVEPISSAIGHAFSDLYSNVIKPISSAISGAWSAIGAGLQWAWDHVIGPVLSAIGGAIQHTIDLLNTLKGNPNGITSSGGTLTGGLVTGGGGATHVPTRAMGGTIFGRGSGTSDSILARLSNGEEVINARQASKHRGLLKAINAGIGGFASGGTISTGMLGGKKIWIYGGTDYASLLGATNAYNHDHNGKTIYNVAGKQYATLIGAENHAQTIVASQVRLQVKVDTKDLPHFAKAVKGTVEQAKAAFQSLYADDQAAGASKSFLSHLRKENALLDREIGIRNGLKDKLKAVQAAMASLSSSVKGAVTGFFSVGSAGASPVTGRISGAGILAQQRQALTQIRAFSAGIKRLENRHLNHQYLMELASQGPSALPEINGLLSLSPKLFGDVNRNASAINRIAGATGAGVAKDVYGAQAASLAASERAADRRAEKTAHVIAVAVAAAARTYADRPIDVKVHGKTLLEIVRHEENRQGRR